LLFGGAVAAMASCAMECCKLLAKSCSVCNRQICKGQGKTCQETAGGCGKTLCSACCSYALVPEAEALRLGAGEGSSAMAAGLYCKPCFQRNNLLDFSRTVDVFGPARGAAPCLLFVHGLINCRSSFREHAEQLSKAHGIRCVLMDLPGHGARMDEDLSADSAFEAIERAAQEYCVAAGGPPTVILGVSLGGYLTMEALRRAPQLFSGAILVECNYNFGVGCSAKSKLKMWMARFFIGQITRGSNAAAFQAVRKAFSANSHISTESLTTAVLRTGVFHSQASAGINILRGLDVLGALSRFKGPVLFMQATKGDEQLFMASTERGQLKYAEGGDHQYPIDDRFMQAFIADCAAFVAEVASEAPANA